MTDFQREVTERIAANEANTRLRDAARAFMHLTTQPKYSYNFAWLGRPIIQYPQDVIAMQELIWKTKPDLIIETGIAHGGSLVMSASMLALLDYCDAQQSGELLDPAKSSRKVLGVDIDIRAHNRSAIEAHPLSSRIHMLQGSSVDSEIISKVHEYARNFNRVLVSLDSDHTHEHVLAELHAYAPLTTMNSYCVVFDTVIEDMPSGSYPDRRWGPDNNPRTAVREYLKNHDGFEIDTQIDFKLLISVAPNGYLKRVR